MKQNELDFVRSGLTNYIGALQNDVDAEGLDKNQYVVGVLMDEILNTSKISPDEPEYCNLYILIPMLSAMQGILLQQMQIMNRQIRNTESQEEIEECNHRIIRYKAMNEELDYLMEKSMAEAAGQPQEGK